MHFKMKSDFEREFQNPTIWKNAKINYDHLKIKYFYFFILKIETNNWN